MATYQELVCSGVIWENYLMTGKIEARDTRSSCEPVGLGDLSVKLGFSVFFV